MAEDRLTGQLARQAGRLRRVSPWVTGAAAGVVAAGGAVELAGGLPAGTAAGRFTDWVVGAGFAGAALRGSATRVNRGLTRDVALGLATAAAWFGATATALLPPGPAAGLLALAYRGPLLHWLLRRAGGRVRGPALAVLAAGYAAAFTGTRPAALVTSGAALGLAGVVAVGARRQQDDARRVARGATVVLVALASAWAAVAAGVVPVSLRQALDTAALLGAVALLARRAANGGLSGAVGSLVVELGPRDRQRPPVSATLARALADPQLQVYGYDPGTGWADELGRPVPDPVVAHPGQVTVADAPDGGRVALVHGEPGAAGGPLARAAASAALLALESVRLEAHVRREAAAVRESTARLVVVDDEERRSLADRLRAGPLARLEHLRGALAGDADLGPLTEELDRVLADLGDLAAGLAPGGLGSDGLTTTLGRLCDGLGLPVEHRLSPRADDLPADLAALVYFVAAEALTNVVRHAAARRARLTLDVDGTDLALTVEDDGRGGAVVDPGGGLQGLVDRVELAGGRITVDSPRGGPTRLEARVPRDPEG